MRGQLVENLGAPFAQGAGKHLLPEPLTPAPLSVGQLAKREERSGPSSAGGGGLGARREGLSQGAPQVLLERIDDQGLELARLLGDLDGHLAARLLRRPLEEIGEHHLQLGHQGCLRIGRSDRSEGLGEALGPVTYKLLAVAARAVDLL